MKSVDQAELRGDIAMMSGDDEDSTWAAVDARTGKALWLYHESNPTGRKLRGGAQLTPSATFRIVGGADDWKVILPYHRFPCPFTGVSTAKCTPGFAPSTEEHGLVALSGKDGSVLWQTPIVGGPVRTDNPGVDYDLNEETAGGDDHTTVIDVAGQFSSESGEDQTVAIDTDDGSVRWRYPHSQAVLMTGGTVFQGPGRLPDGMPGAGPETALDPLTGATRWSLPAGWLAAAGAGDTVLTNDQGLRPDTVLELDDTGHTLATALPGHVVAISDRYAVFASGQRYPGTFAVYGVATRGVIRGATRSGSWHDRILRY